MPGLVYHNVVDHLRLLYGIGKLAVGFGVPALVQPVNVVLADKVEIILVLSDHKVVVMQIVDELIQHEMQSELFAVYQYEARIEKVVAGHSDYLLGVVAELLGLHHDLLAAGSKIGVLYILEIDPADVPAYHRIAVDIESLGVVGEHLRDEYPVICGDGVIVTHRQLVGNGFKIGRNVNETDLKAVVRQLAHHGSHPLGYFGIKDMHCVPVFP